MAFLGGSVFHTERRTAFDSPAPVVWAALTRAGHYQRWWPWLQDFDGTLVADGERWACTIKAPLPYTVSFDLVLREVDHARRSVAADITGEITGTAGIDVVTSDGNRSGCDIVLVADLVPASAFLRGLTRVAGPVARRGHDLVIDRALAQFARTALGPAADR